jgi:methionine-rich copper-binding protein CopC
MRTSKSASRRQSRRPLSEAVHIEALEARRMLSATLVGAYSLDEATGTKVNDLSGNNNVGTVANATWATGKFGSGLQFTGAANSMVTIADSTSLHLTSGMTLEAWVYPTTLNSIDDGWCAVVAKDNPGNANDILYSMYAAQGTGTGPSTHLLVGSTDRGTGSAGLLPLNTWTFVSSTYDGATIRTYVNGTQVATKAQTGPIVSKSSPLHIGGDWSGEMFTGIIDNVRIYNGALTAAQIQSDMTTPLGVVNPTVIAQSPASAATNVSALTTVTATFNESIVSSSLVFTLLDASNNPVATTVSYNDSTHVATLTPIAPLKAGVKYTASVTAANDAAGYSLSSAVTWAFTTIAPTVTAQTPAGGATGVARNASPTVTFNESIQSTSITLSLTGPGNVSVPGAVSYSDTTHTATFTPSVWLAGNTLYTVTLSSATDAAGNSIAGPTSWTFSTIPAVLPAVVSEIPTINGSNVALGSTISATFNEAIVPATATFSVIDPSNATVPGSIAYNASTFTLTFTPTSALVAASNYTVSVSGVQDPAGDMMVTPLTWSFSTVPAQPSPLQIIAQTPAPNATGVSIQTAVTVVFNESILPSTLTFVLRDQKANPIAATVTYDDTTHTATLTPTAPLTTGRSYNAIASDAQDLAGNLMDHYSWVFTAQLPGTGPFSVWPPSATPVSPNDSDPASTEVGVKFRSDAAGVITGLRFYKGAQNTGVHIGHLWSSTGVLLGTATFSGESATGWQQVNFATPISVNANTTYVASYLAPVGHYAEDDNFFSASGVDNVPLHALKAGVDGINGVYLHTTTGAFPTQDFLSANFWVDVVFDSATPLGPTVTATTPAAGSTNISVSSTITATFSVGVVASSISFSVLDATNTAIAGSVTYNSTSQTATFTPLTPLSASTSYTATINSATDLNGNMLASPNSWTFTTADPAQDPSQVGQWSSVMSWPLVAINQILLNNGQILMYDGGPACIGSSSATVYNPATGVFTSVPVDNSADDNDIFCSGAVILADGRVVVVGGHDCTGKDTGIASLNIYDPSTQTWMRGPNMAYKRWYPTATLLSDGRVLVTAGADVTDTSLVPIPEIYDPVANKWTSLTGASQTINNYPFMFQLPDGRVLEAGSDEAPQVTKTLNLSTNTWSVVDPSLLDASSGVMYRPGKILKAGTSCPEENEVDSAPSSNTAYTLDMTSANPQWQTTGSMANARTWLDLTMLPNGDVLATGGSRTIGGVDPSTAVLPAESWDPNTGVWTTLASMATPRMYHSTALLLPDGRVLVAGGGHNYRNNADYYSAEYYSPAYLFKGARPTIASVPNELQYGSIFTITTPDASNIESVALIHAGAVTHAFDEAQSYVPLSFTIGAGSLSVTAPSNPNLAVPGYYMLFIVNGNGVPCVAPFVHLPASYEDTIPPSAPATLNATGGYGSVALSWSAATDNVGVVGYNVYRSTSAGFSPSAANMIATVTGLSYTDSGLAAGTYYYLVTAQDAAENVSAPSPQASTVVLADTVAPTVSITAPTAGATLSGVTTLTANASDNVAVVGVQFQVDGANVGAEVTTAPYSLAPAIQWATAPIQSQPSPAMPPETKPLPRPSMSRSPTP